MSRQEQFPGLILLDNTPPLIPVTSRTKVMPFMTQWNGPDSDSETSINQEQSN
jgi:hypothetical protein